MLLLKYGADPTIKVEYGTNSEISPAEYFMEYKSDCARAIMDDYLMKQEVKSSLFIKLQLQCRWLL